VITNAGHIFLLVAKGGIKRIERIDANGLPSQGKALCIGEPDPGRLASDPCAQEFRTETSVATDVDAIGALANLAAVGRRLDKPPGLGAIANGIGNRTSASCPLAPNLSVPDPRAWMDRRGRRSEQKDWKQIMSTITMKDGAEIYYKDWGTGPPVVFCHGWPLTADSWEGQMLFLAANGYRCIAHDRRGHGRSSQTWTGNDMDTYAEDLSQLIETLELHGAVLIGFSAGGGEVARYIGRHGTKRLAKVALIAAVTPLMLKTDENPDGLPIEVFDGLRTSSIGDRSQFYMDLAGGPFFGANRPGAKVSQGMIDSFWHQGVMAGHRNAYECIRAFSETNFSEDLRKFDVPTLIVHGDDDQIVPIGASALRAAKLVKYATLKVYAGAPHGLIQTHKSRINADLLEFLKT
jgi:non-heme chloroperoxidase